SEASESVLVNGLSLVSSVSSITDEGVACFSARGSSLAWIARACQSMLALLFGPVGCFILLSFTAGPVGPVSALGLIPLMLVGPVEPVGPCGAMLCMGYSLVVSWNAFAPPLQPMRKAPVGWSAQPRAPWPSRTARVRWPRRQAAAENQRQKSPRLAADDWARPAVPA